MTAKKWKQQWSHSSYAWIQDRLEISPLSVLPGSESTLTVVQSYTLMGQNTYSTWDSQREI